MYAENICTPTRAAFMTGRLAVRTGMEVTKVTPPEGVGLNGKEVTIAELLSDAGYATHHIGKWHLGDIREAYPINQGFDYASFPMHNQVSYSFLTRDAELDAATTSYMPESIDPDYGLDKTFRLYDWVTQVEGTKGGKVREWGINPGERPDTEFYKKVNQRFQEQALGSLRALANGDKLFVGDLYTTFARIAGASDGIPRDRVVDGIDQTALLLKGDTHGRRDYVHLYEMDVLKGTVKQNMKIHWPAPGVNPAMAGVFNLYWDPREEHPLRQQGVWTGTPFVRMRVQHMRLKDKYPDWQPARGMPYEDVENLRPETKEMVETWLNVYGDAKDVILGVEAAGN